MNAPIRAPLLGALIAAAALAPTPARAQAQSSQTITLDTAMWGSIARGARAKTAELTATRPAENARAVSQYREALGLSDRGRYDSASTMLYAVILRSPNNPLFQGEHAYILARLGRWEDAANVYTRCYQLLQQNAWFLVGVAAARAGNQQWADAAGTIQLAAQTDSAVITPAIAVAAVSWFEQAGDRGNALTWARLASQRTPDDPAIWLRIATYQRARGDSTGEGLAAIRRYRTMRPDDKLGMALYADYLYMKDQTDSAMALINVAVEDSTYREYAAQLYLQVGRDKVQRRDAEAAVRTLATGLPWATAAQRPIYANVMGRAQLLQVNTTLERTQTDRSCALARSADSLVTESERNLRAGVSFDSARTASFLDNIVPGYKQNAQTAIRNCRDAPATPPRPARPAARPATRPAGRP